MTLDEIQLGFRMIAQGRPQQDAAQKLAEALAVVLASPEERLAMSVQDEVKPAVSGGEGGNAESAPKRRGRPPKVRP